MKVLLIGGGGREHAMAEALLRNSQVTELICAPGNGGTACLKRCRNVEKTGIEEIFLLAKEEKVDFTVVGPEALLAEGIADRFLAAGMRIFGANQKSARLESSKAYAKDFMQKYGVKTAAYQTFQSSEKAKNYLDQWEEYPVVVKASGLALGKGVFICETRERAKAAVTDLMEKNIFSTAGQEIVIEAFLEGVEASILTVVSNGEIIELPSAKDHKRIFDGDQGENTGGMGAICPSPHFTKERHEAFLQDIVRPTLKGMEAEGLDFRGALFFGLMMNDKGVYLLEYNVRFGDPETQAVLPLLKSDFLELLERTVDGTLSGYHMEVEKGFSVCVTAVSGGYPGTYQKGYPVSGVDQAENTVYIAGAARQADGTLLTSGGRVLNVEAQGESLAEAQRKAYADMENIQFQNIFYRKDIGGRF